MLSDIPPIATMRGLAGTAEYPGAADNPVILGWRSEIAAAFPEFGGYPLVNNHDATAWCGDTVALCMVRAGYRPPFDPGSDERSYRWVDAWADWGDPVAPGDEQPGDVLVFRSPHHVTLYDGEDGNCYWGLGGNQSDQVDRTRFAKSGIRAIRRPAARDRVAARAVTDAALSSGRGSWYSQYQGRHAWVDRGDKPNSNALGVPDDAQGVSFYNKSTLGAWFEVHAPNGIVSIEQQTDVGPSPSTGRLIDVSAAAAERMGYSPSSFPTDSVFRWRPVEPPAAVAGLTAKQQAAAYRDLRGRAERQEERGRPMTDTTVPVPTAPNPAPAPLPAPALRPALDLDAIADIAHRIEGAALNVSQAAATVGRAVDAMIAVRAGQMPMSQVPSPTPAPAPAAATPAAPEKSTLGFGTGILALLANIAAVKAGQLGMPAGEGATMAGGLVPAASVALSVLGMAGKVRPGLQMVLSVAQLLFGMKKPAV